MASSKYAPARSTSPPRRTKAACDDCPALCCHNLAVIIEKPKDQDDIDFYKWHLQYDTVSLAIRSNRWYLSIEGRCIYLDRDNFCTIYDRRPAICRKHNPPDCEKFGHWYDVMLHTPAELVNYLEAEKDRRRMRRRKQRRKKKAAAKKSGTRK